MGIIENAQRWLWTVAVRKVIVAVVGFLASQQAITGFEWLQAHGITIAIDPVKFQTEATVAGIALFTTVHDWIKVKFPDAKWL